MRNIVTKEYLKTLGTDWNGKSMTAGTTYNSDAIRHHFSEGNSSLLVKTTAGMLTITYQLSNDQKNWYDPYGIDESIVPGLGVLSGNRWIVFNPAPAEWIRFVFALATDDSTVTAEVMSQERAA